MPRTEGSTEMQQTEMHPLSRARAATHPAARNFALNVPFHPFLPSRSGPWTDADDVRLRKFMAPFVHDEHPPWPLISTRCNFGHNSGSCEKRWAEIPTTKTSKWDAGKRFEFKGATGGGEVIGYKGQFSTPYVPV